LIFFHDCILLTLYLSPDPLHDLHEHLSLGLRVFLIQLKVLGCDPLEARLAGLEPVELPHGPLVALQAPLEGATLNQLRPEVHGHFVPAQGLELVLTLVRVSQLLTQTLPQLLQGLRRCKVVVGLRSGL